MSQEYTFREAEEPRGTQGDLLLQKKGSDYALDK